MGWHTKTKPFRNAEQPVFTKNAITQHSTLQIVSERDGLLLNWDTVEIGSVKIRLVMKNIFEAAHDAPFGGRESAIAVQHIHLVLVPAAEAVEIFELLDGHTGVVIPAITAHKAALLLLKVVECVAVEVADRGSDDLVDKSLVIVDKATHTPFLLGMAAERKHEETRKPKASPPQDAEAEAFGHLIRRTANRCRHS